MPFPDQLSSWNEMCFISVTCLLEAILKYGRVDDAICVAIVETHIDEYLQLVILLSESQVISSIQLRVQLQRQERTGKGLMTHQTTIRNAQCEIDLTYDKLQKNLGKLIKIHNEVQNLHVLPRDEGADKGADLLQQAFNQDAPLRRSCTEQRSLTRHSYPLNSNEAVQLIWRAAAIAKELDITPAMLEGMQEDEYIGEQNKMGQLIEAIEKEVKGLGRKVGEGHKRVIKAHKYLQQLRDIKQYISSTWKSLHQRHKKVFHQLQISPLISLSSPTLSPNEKALITKHIQKEIISLDLNLLKETLMFILEVKGSDRCLVILEQCYICFLAKKEQLISIIGLYAYNEGKKNFQVAKEMSCAQQRAFRVKDFKMCHKCLQMFLPSKESDDYYICHNTKILPDATTTPYAYQQIALLSNYSVVPNFYQKEKGKSVTQEVPFDKYVHPYAMTFSSYCSRFTCADCFASYSNTKKKEGSTGEKTEEPSVDEPIPFQSQRSLRSTRQSKEQAPLEPKIEKPKLKKPQYCHFCQSLCECERCSKLESLNKLLALFTLMGGDFQQISSELLFCNWNSKKLEIQIIYEENLGTYDRLAVSELPTNATQSVPDEIEKVEKKKPSTLFNKKSKKQRKEEKIMQKEEKKQQKHERKVPTQKCLKEEAKAATNSKGQKMVDTQLKIDQNEQPHNYRMTIDDEQLISKERSTAESESPSYTELKKMFLMIRLQEDFESSQDEQKQPEKVVQIQSLPPKPKRKIKSKPKSIKQYHLDEVEEQEEKHDLYFESQDDNCIN